jgi:hypothetical protein
MQIKGYLVSTKFLIGGKSGECLLKVILVSAKFLKGGESPTAALDHPLYSSRQKSHSGLECLSTGTGTYYIQCLLKVILVSAKFLKGGESPTAALDHPLYSSRQKSHSGLECLSTGTGTYYIRNRYRYGFVILLSVLGALLRMTIFYCDRQIPTKSWRTQLLRVCVLCTTPQLDKPPIITASWLQKLLRFCHNLVRNSRFCSYLRSAQLHNKRRHSIENFPNLPCFKARLCRHHEEKPIPSRSQQEVSQSGPKMCFF